MKFRYLIFNLVLLCTFNVYGLKSNSSDLINRNVCSHYELALANSDGTITKKECYDSYSLAKKAMDSDINTEENNYDNEIILERSNGVTRVIDAKYAVVKLDKGKDALTYLYSKSNGTGNSTYMNNYSSYGAVDGAFIEYNENYKTVKVKVGGEKSGLLEHVFVRVSEDFVYEVHLDTDDANAFLINQGDEAELIIDKEL